VYSTPLKLEIFAADNQAGAELMVLPNTTQCLKYLKNETLLIEQFEKTLSFFQIMKLLDRVTMLFYRVTI
jgi:hypothetical protein